MNQILWPSRVKTSIDLNPYLDKESDSESDVEVHAYEEFINSTSEYDPCQILDQMIGQTITGKKLNKILRGLPLLKFMYNNDQHYGMKYVTGRNQDIIPFIDSGECEKGGIYVTTIMHFNDYYRVFGNYARRVKIDSDALIHIERNKLKCNKVVLEERFEKKVLVKKIFTVTLQCGYSGIIQKIIQNNSRSLKYVEQKLMTKDIMKCAVKKDGYSIKYIDPLRRTPGLIQKAIEQNSLCLQYIDPMQINEKLRYVAVKNNAMAMQYIDPVDVTKEIIEMALKNYTFVIRFIDQILLTPDVIRFAVEQKCCALFQINSSMITKELEDIAIEQCKKSKCVYCRDRLLQILNKRKEIYKE